MNSVSFPDLSQFSTCGRGLRTRPGTMEGSALFYAFLAYHDELVKRLEPKGLFPVLVTENIITLDEREEIEHKVTSPCKVDKLLDVVHGKGSCDGSIYERFLCVLREAGTTCGQQLGDIAQGILEKSREEGIEKRFAHALGDPALRKHELDIVQCLDVKEVLPCLVGAGVVSLKQNEEVRSGRTRIDRASALVHILFDKGTFGFEEFVKALHQSESYKNLGQLLDMYPQASGEKTTDSTDVEWFSELEISDSSPYLEGTHWQKLQQLQRGVSYSYYHAIDMKSNTFFAVKQVSFNRNKEREEVLRSLHREVKIHQRLHHPNLVKCLGAVHTEGWFNIFVEWIPGGSVKQLLKLVGAFPEPVVCNYTRQIIHAIAYLHENGIIHRNIKGTNVLVDQTGRKVLISDFGTAATMISSATESGEFKDTKGTVPFMAPEVVKAGGYGRKRDVWSIGCVIIQMATAKLPWDGVCDVTNVYSLVFTIGTASEPPPIPYFENPLLKDLTVQCLRINPDDRPTTAELLKHPLFTSR